MLTLRQVLDASVAILADAYRSYGMDFFTAVRSAMTVGIPEEEKPKEAEPVPEPDNEESMKALEAMMSGTGMRFAR